jgi:histidinol-phosphatase
MHSRELQAALDAAQAAARVIQGFYLQAVEVRFKDDHSPVTAADVQAEQVIREILSQRFPQYGFYGEETGQERGDGEHTWLVDPIDGTKSFVRGCEFFSTQIALQRAGQLVLGVSSAPIYGEIAYAEVGQGARLNDETLRVSPVRELSAAILSGGNLKTLAAGPAWNGFGRLIGTVNRIRGYGDFLHYHLLARGALDLVLESDVNILDIAALVVIVREAGGIFTDLNGQAVNLNTTSVLAASSEAIHQQALGILTR